MNDILRCPVCGGKLNKSEFGLACDRRHSFDRAKEGYVNLLSGNRPGSERGDGREMALSRRAFLNKGYYSALADTLGGLLGGLCPSGGNVLDICCGEGYYTEQLARKFLKLSFFGFDISREMIRLAAKRRCGAEFFVANIASIPVRDGAVDLALHLFAPFHAGEFSRVLAPGGYLLSVIPGKDHLMGLKSVLYEKPYPNDEKEPDTGALAVADRVRVSGEISLSSSEDISALFQMTPYYFRTGASAAERLLSLSSLSTEIEFVILVCEKK